MEATKKKKKKGFHELLNFELQSAFVDSRILRYFRVRAPRNFSVPRPVFNGCAAKVAGKRRWFALREKRRRLAPSQKGSSMIVLWHSIAFENIMMVDQVPFSRYYAIKLFCVKWSLFPWRVTYYNSNVTELLTLHKRSQPDVSDLEMADALPLRRYD